ncbi:hypothetical protein [Nonomuraea sp. KM90]|uniref:hypothetical protein n=1 Tax=Nonomuraea sp. KM90 TaxID=3457428 RepID=UPI003FCE40DF
MPNIVRIRLARRGEGSIAEALAASALGQTAYPGAIAAAIDEGADPDRPGMSHRGRPIHHVSSPTLPDLRGSAAHTGVELVLVKEIHNVNLATRIWAEVFGLGPAPRGEQVGSAGSASSSSAGRPPYLAGDLAGQAALLAVGRAAVEQAGQSGYVVGAGATMTTTGPSVSLSYARVSYMVFFSVIWRGTPGVYARGGNGSAGGPPGPSGAVTVARRELLSLAVSGSRCIP